MSHTSQTNLAATPTAKRGLPLASPLKSLADAVGSAVVRAVARHRPYDTTAYLSATRSRARRGASDPAVDSSPTDLELEAEIRELTVQVLGSAVAALSHDSRMALIALLAEEAEAAVEDSTAAHTSEGPDSTLTTAEAAVRLEGSRPYVSMLCDAGKLGKVVKTEGGHRRISASAVAAFLSARTQEYLDVPTPRKAGVAARLYDEEDEHYANAVRGEPVVGRRASPQVAAEAQPSRKPRN